MSLTPAPARHDQAATFWENIEAGHGVDRQAVTMPLMVEGLFGAGAVLISFGAVLGKTTPSQLVVIAFWEVSVVAPGVSPRGVWKAHTLT